MDTAPQAVELLRNWIASERAGRCFIPGAGGIASPRSTIGALTFARRNQPTNDLFNIATSARQGAHHHGSRGRDPSPAGGRTSRDECFLALQWAYETGKRPTQEQLLVWNSFMTKRGWRDKATASLNRWKTELGLADRADIETFFDLYDADEGRDVRGDYSSE
jgi:hypothetical protein